MISAIILGIIIGIFSGLFPGLHTNLIAVFVATLTLDIWFTSVFLISTAISRSVVDVIPTVFLGFADEQNVMALLPAHKLLKKGGGLSAVKFTVAGSLLGVIAGVSLIPLFIFLFPFLYNLLRPHLFLILLLLIGILFFKESKWYLAILVFLLAGILGFLSLNYIKQPLFPLLSGLFGASGLLISLFDKTEIPPQSTEEILNISKFKLFSSTLFGVIAGSIVTLFPGLSPSQAAALTQVKRTKPIPYLVLIGALGTVDVLISLVTFFTLGKARNGAVVVIESLIGSFSLTALIYLVCAALIAVGVASISSLFIAEIERLSIEKIKLLRRNIIES